MEELFASSQAQGVKPTRQHSPHRGTRTEISILDAKRSMNVGIFLKQFKRPVADIVTDIRQGVAAMYGADLLTELRKMLPEKEEVKQLRAFDGDRGLLCEADRFMLLLVHVPSYVELLDSLVLREEFGPLLATLSVAVGTLTQAAGEILHCEELRTVLYLVLKTGNHMNAGGYAGNAFGYKMTSLLKLVDTRANKPGMNLMHFVVMEVEKNDKKLLDFPNKLQSIGPASRILQQETERDFEKLKQKLAMVKGSVHKLPEIREQMEDFIQGAEGQLQQLQAALEELQAVSCDLANYLCEEQQHFQLDECCRIFTVFGEKFLKAKEDNRQRRAGERRRRQREEAAAKRLSIASCSHRELGVPGLESLLLGPGSASGQLPRSRSLRQFPAGVPGTAGDGGPGDGRPEEARRLREVSERLMARRVAGGPNKPGRDSLSPASPLSRARPRSLPPGVAPAHSHGPPTPPGAPAPAPALPRGPPAPAPAPARPRGPPAPALPRGPPTPDIPLAPTPGPGPSSLGSGPPLPPEPAPSEAPGNSSASPPAPARPRSPPPPTPPPAAAPAASPPRARPSLQRFPSADKASLPAATRRSWAARVRRLSTPSSSASTSTRRPSSSQGPSTDTPSHSTSTRRPFSTPSSSKGPSFAPSSTIASPRRKPSSSSTSTRGPSSQGPPSPSSTTPRRPSSTSPPRRVKPPAGEQPERVQESPGPWNISSIFGKKPAKAKAGAGAGAESGSGAGAGAGVEAERAPTHSAGTGFFSNLFKRFSDNKPQ